MAWKHSLISHDLEACLCKNTISQFNQFVLEKKKKSSFYFLPELCPQKLYDILYATQKVRYMWLSREICGKLKVDAITVALYHESRTLSQSI